VPRFLAWASLLHERRRLGAGIAVAHHGAAQHQPRAAAERLEEAGDDQVEMPAAA